MPCGGKSETANPARTQVSNGMNFRIDSSLGHNIECRELGLADIIGSICSELCLIAHNQLSTLSALQENADRLLPDISHNIRPKAYAPTLIIVLPPLRSAKSGKWPSGLRA
jgi:hypothetical protein